MWRRIGICEVGHRDDGKARDYFGLKRAGLRFAPTDRFFGLAATLANFALHARARRAIGQYPAR